MQQQAPPTHPQQEIITLLFLVAHLIQVALEGATRDKGAHHTPRKVVVHPLQQLPPSVLMDPLVLTLTATPVALLESHLRCLSRILLMGQVNPTQMQGINLHLSLLEVPSRMNLGSQGMVKVKCTSNLASLQFRKSMLMGTWFPETL